MLHKQLYWWREHASELWVYHPKGSMQLKGIAYDILLQNSHELAGRPRAVDTDAPAIPVQFVSLDAHHGSVLTCRDASDDELQQLLMVGAREQLCRHYLEDAATGS